jgi:hypothetical protein
MYRCEAFSANCGSKAWVAGEKSPAAVMGTEPGVAQVFQSPLRYRLFRSGLHVVEGTM